MLVNENPSIVKHKRVQSKRVKGKCVEPEDLWPEEWVAWFHLSPAERWRESSLLWQIFLTLGGSLDPEPDTQSPFYDPQAPPPSSSDGRPECPLGRMSVVPRSGV